MSVYGHSTSQNVVVQWNKAALQGVRDSKLGPPMVARALAIVHTCMYDAWAAYDPRALGTQLRATLRQGPAARTLANKREVISYAAYRAAVDLFPADEATVFRPLMIELGYNPDRDTVDPSTAAGVGNIACAAVLAFRHHDGANQLGDLSGNGVPYADYTGYRPLNPPSTVPVVPGSIVDPNRWQPLQYIDASGKSVTQTFLGAQWGEVIPFGLNSGSEFRDAIGSRGPALYGSPEYFEQAEELIHLSANLTDEQKMIAEYWKDGPHSETPPGHWCLFAQFVSVRDHHTLDQDIKLFFALTNAEFDASIVAWDAKLAFDSIRPASAICYLFKGQPIRSWGGPGKGAVAMQGEQWIPYQPAAFPTPPFPEYVSGHSTFSAAGAAVLRLFTGSDRFFRRHFRAHQCSLDDSFSLPDAIVLAHHVINPVFRSIGYAHPVCHTSRSVSASAPCAFGPSNRSMSGVCGSTGYHNNVPWPQSVTGYRDKDTTFQTCV